MVRKDIEMSLILNLQCKLLQVPWARVIGQPFGLMICIQWELMFSVSMIHLAPARPISGKRWEGPSSTRDVGGKFWMSTCTEVKDLDWKVTDCLTLAKPESKGVLCHIKYGFMYFQEVYTNNDCLMEFVKDMKIMSTTPRERDRETTPRLQCLSPSTATASAIPVHRNSLLSIPNFVFI